jgi:glycosyltransferase involved in cell wall biosynthesis
VVASGEGWKAQAVQRWGLDPERVTVVENGTTLLRLLKREQLRAFRDGEPAAREMRLVYLGGFLPWHGISVLLRAMGRLVRGGANLRLALIGSGEGVEETRREIASGGLADRVELTGSLPPAVYAPILADADIGLSPYCGWKEYAGLKLYDYKAAGLAIVASGEGGQPSSLQHGRTGWIVPPCDEEALASAIIRLASDSDLRRRMGRQARIEAERCHGWNETARRLESIFLRVSAHAD